MRATSFSSPYSYDDLIHSYEYVNPSNHVKYYFYFDCKYGDLIRKVEPNKVDQTLRSSTTEIYQFINKIKQFGWREVL